MELGPAPELGRQRNSKQGKWVLLIHLASAKATLARTGHSCRGACNLVIDKGVLLLVKQRPFGVPTTCR